MTDARRHLVALEKTGLKHPAIFHLRALVEHRLGEFAEAGRAFAAASGLAPQDPQIANNHGNLLSDVGEEAKALEAYERALRLAPGFAEAALNRAVALLNLGRRQEARSAFAALAPSQSNDPRYWNGVGALEREEGNLEAAAAAYDRALRLEPNDRLAHRARAQLAFDRGEGDAAERYAGARRLAPEDRDLLLEETQARLAEGDRSALDDLGKVVRAAPDWAQGQIAYARSCWEAGRPEAFDAAVRDIVGRAPTQPALWEPVINLLAECGRHSEAADLARDARASVGDQPVFLLYEAAQASRAGDQERALGLYGRLPAELPGRALREANCRLRSGEIERALPLIDAALEEDGSNIAAWALAELIYRTAGDPRSTWLSGQPNLIASFDLPLSPDRLAALRNLLLQLHANSTLCAGKSVRDGTQTRGLLFNRLEPELAELKKAIEQTIASYWEGLPPFDRSHPLLRHRHSAMKIAGSWSVRLTGAGRHVSHYHPEGLISSASYFIVPDSVATPGDGWLELGRPPSEFSLDLEPLATIMPKPGLVVLFPSYLHHGTRPFSVGERLTVAFDVERA